MGCWFRIRHSFLNLWSRFCSVASFAVFWSKITLSQIFRNFEKKLTFLFDFGKAMKFLAVCKKKSFELDKRFESYRTLKLKNHKNFATLKKINFAIKLSLGLKNQKCNVLMYFFILKPKTTSVFFSHRPFRSGYVLRENWQFCKMG